MRQDGLCGRHLQELQPHLGVSAYIVWVYFAGPQETATFRLWNSWHEHLLIQEECNCKLWGDSKQWL